MFRLKIFKMIFLGMIFPLALNVTGVMAQDRCLFPTVTEEVNFPEGWHDFLSESELSIVCDNDGVTLGHGSTCDHVGSGCTVVLRMEVTSGNTLPPYEWTISGTGFYFDMGGGVPGYTISDVSAEETFDICSATTACGTGTVTVTDNYGNTDSAYIRSANGGWISCYYSGGPTYCNCGYHRGWCTMYIDGHWVQVYCCCGPGNGNTYPSIGPGTCDDGWVSDTYYADDWAGTDCPEGLPADSCYGFQRMYIYKWTCSSPIE